MLSVCIPIYNQDVTSLVKELHQQASILSVDAEILMLDDASEESFRIINRPLAELPLTRYEELKMNIGRSRIRNTLAQKAKFPLLLFLDCDIAVGRTDFLKRYLEAGKDGSIVCGGHHYQPDPPPRPHLLHWLFGTKRETRSAACRQQHPHHAFMTASFLIPASILYQLPFNEELHGYGHEDTLYGFQLMQGHIPVKHIDNPVIHNGLETAEEFLEKTKTSLKNLVRVYELTSHNRAFRDMVRVLKTCETIKKLRARQVFMFFYSMVNRPLYRSLTGPHPRLWMLDIYKLGNICQKRT